MKNMLSLLLCASVVSSASLEAMPYRHMNPHRKSAKNYNNTRQGKKDAKLQRLAELALILYAPQQQDKKHKKHRPPLTEPEIRMSLRDASQSIMEETPNTSRIVTEDVKEQKTSMSVATEKTSEEKDENRSALDESAALMAAVLQDQNFSRDNLSIDEDKVSICVATKKTSKETDENPTALDLEDAALVTAMLQDLLREDERGDNSTIEEEKEEDTETKEFQSDTDSILLNVAILKTLKAKEIIDDLKMILAAALDRLSDLDSTVNTQLSCLTNQRH